MDFIELLLYSKNPDSYKKTVKNSIFFKLGVKESLNAKENSNKTNIINLILHESYSVTYMKPCMKYNFMNVFLEISENFASIKDLIYIMSFFTRNALFPLKNKSILLRFFHEKPNLCCFRLETKGCLLIS